MFFNNFPAVRLPPSANFLVLAPGISHGRNLRGKYIYQILFRKVMPINVTDVTTKTNKFTPRLTGDFACIMFFTG